jgi:hypothetical protein
MSVVELPLCTVIFKYRRENEISVTSVRRSDWLYTTLFTGKEINRVSDLLTQHHDVPCRNNYSPFQFKCNVKDLLNACIFRQPTTQRFPAWCAYSVSLLVFQGSSFCTFLERHASNKSIQPEHNLNNHFSVSFATVFINRDRNFRLFQGLPSGLLPQIFPHKILYALLVSLVNFYTYCHWY